MVTHSQTFLFVSLMMAIVITLLLVVNHLFAKKISAKARYLMWVVVMIGLIIPFRPFIGDGVIEVPNFQATAGEIMEMPVLNNQGTHLIEPPVTQTEISNQTVIENELISFQAIVVVVWAAVAVGMIGYHLFQYIRFQKSVKRWGEPEEDQNALTIFERIKEEMGLSHCKVKLIVCGFVSTSMLTGFLKPIILLPEKNYDDTELELIFRHELIHYRRKDLWIKLLSVTAVALHWFNPLVHLMNIFLQTEGEASCDQEVLEMSKLKNRHFYAEVIIGMIGEKKSGMTMLTTNFYGGKKGIKKRLEEIMIVATPRKSISYVFLVLIVSLTVMSGSVFATTNQQDSPNVASMDEQTALLFDVALSVVGGGEVIDYQLIDEDNVAVVRVQYEHEIFIVQLDLLDYQVRGLSSYRPRNIDTTTDATVLEQPVYDETDGEEDTLDLTPQNPAITLQQAIDIATAEIVARGHSSASFIESEIDFEYGQWVWEVAFSYRGGAIEVYVDANDGRIVKFEVDID